MQVQGPDVYHRGFGYMRKWRACGVCIVYSTAVQFEVAETMEQVFVGLRFKFY